MHRILSNQLPQHVGETVTVAGWVHRRRVLANVTFVILRDRGGLLQIVTRHDETQEEQVVEVTGKVVANSVAPGGVELVEPVFTVLGPAEPPPVELFRPELKASLPVLLDHAAVALRHPARRKVFAASAAVVGAFRAALDEQGFTEVFTPKIVGSATESGANVFQLDYFQQKAYLAQSPQFYKQTMVGVFERVYEVGPVFRAEPHDTSRHLATYTSLDAELGFIESHRDVMAVLTEVIRAMVGAVNNHGYDVSMPVDVPTLHFAEALKIAGAPEDEPDLAPEHERALGEWALAEHGSDFVFVEGYPMRKRPFYTHPQPGEPRWSNSFDLLFRGLELVTGGQRLHRHADYLAALAREGQDPAPLRTYLEAFQHGMPPHGGFAIGLERFMARVTGAANVRETTLFPRDLHRVAP
ncbi:aspartate--tRNA(Asn) ligase [Dactylosporangium siamense]|uniref:Aspartate--tRNA(Asp/Asn) ligase n=1 Tax=Dactylosporangium siamense TaxID=685454 RepID=A0A919PLK6_9ACTN|nr:aspartate--tRNA(Asn) ligase [Dactylosporangium siamense]GIG44378.1 aspartate--tRNA(Asp/Asn) ligase [Dactylosporangium siamense]